MDRYNNLDKIDRDTATTSLMARVAIPTYPKGFMPQE